MSNRSSSSETPPAVLSIFGGEFCHPTEVELVMPKELPPLFKEVPIRAKHGSAVFLQLKSKVWNTFIRRTLHKADGTIICIFHWKVFTAHRTCYVHPGDVTDNTPAVMTVKRDFFSINPSYQVYLKDSSSVNITVSGNFSESKFELQNAQGVKIASIASENLPLEDASKPVNTYVVTVMPNVDVAMIIALIIIMQENSEAAWATIPNFISNLQFG